MTERHPIDRYCLARDDLRLFYRDYPGPDDGAAVPVVCLHGLTRNSRDFHTLATRVSSHRRVIAPDLRGRGASDRDPDYSHYHPSRYVQDVWSLLEHEGIPAVAVIGTSLGGWMGMEMVRERPEAVAGLVLNDIGPELDPTGLARVQAAAGTVPTAADWGEAARHVRDHYQVAWPDWPASRWLQFARDTYRELEDGTLDVMLDRNVGVAAREGLSGLRHDPWQLFDALRGTPALVLRGALSDILSDSIVQKMRRRKPDLIAVTVPGRGHPPYLDEPEALDAIDEFLEGL